MHGRREIGREEDTDRALALFASQRLTKSQRDLHLSTAAKLPTQYETKSLYFTGSTDVTPKFLLQIKPQLHSSFRKLR